MNDMMRVIGVSGSTTASLEREVAKALRGVTADQIVSISYSAERFLGIWLQHHALIVLSGPQ